MSVDRSTRTLLAILFLLAALFVAMNRVVESAPAGDWWLPLLLFVIGAGFALSLRYQFGSGQPSAAPEEADETAPALSSGSDVHSYRVTATTTAPPAQTMTIRPDADEEAQTQRVVSVEEEGVIPFMGKPADEPAPEADELTEPETTAAEERAEMEAAKAAEGVEVADVEAEVIPETPAPEPEPVPEEPAAAAPAPTGKPDDLTKVRGIGKKSAQALKNAGIDTFQKLANSSVDAIHSALEAGSVRLVGEVDTWTQQAAYAARGDWEGLDRFNAEQRAADGD